LNEDRNIMNDETRCSPDTELATKLWAKLCTDCAHSRSEKCDCLDDILEAFAEIRRGAAQTQSEPDEATLQRAAQAMADADTVDGPSYVDLARACLRAALAPGNAGAVETDIPYREGAFYERSNPARPSPAPDAVRALQSIHDAVNALGGRPDQDNSYDQGIVDTVAKILEIIEKAQAAARSRK
jgi:hypothetical protein